MKWWCCGGLGVWRLVLVVWINWCFCSYPNCCAMLFLSVCLPSGHPVFIILHLFFYTCKWITRHFGALYTYFFIHFDVYSEVWDIWLFDIGECVEIDFGILQLFWTLNCQQPDFPLCPIGFDNGNNFVMWNGMTVNDWHHPFIFEFWEFPDGFFACARPDIVSHRICPITLHGFPVGLFPIKFCHVPIIEWGYDKNGWPDYFELMCLWNLQTNFQKYWIGVIHEISA